MDVFLIPVGLRCHLYCEVGDGAPVEVGGEHRGWRRRALDRFLAIVSGVEAARHGAAERRRRREPRAMARRVSDRVVCWLAEKIAEQRLLWHLRRESRATGWFPDDATEVEADEQIRSILRGDARRHSRWAIVHLVAAGFSLLLMPLPGPNVLGYYFTFRFVGHYLSRVGARHGLQKVAWHLQPSAPLTALRQAVSLESESRQARVAEIASQLRLEHLAAFVNRMAAPTP
jgi:hypothetical protein